MTDIPRILGKRYEIGDLIGRGGMAQVHLGYDTRLSRTVAIKILRTDLAADPMFLARFRREAQSAAALNHPSIVAVYDTGEEEVTTATGVRISLPYIVMEYVKGRTVASLLKSGEPVPIAEAVQVVTGVLSALEYSHREGIVHRDIKPGNVMLTPDGKVKVMDFGIARAIADSAATMTQTNSVVGTAQYLSPEQARGEVVDARSDLYSTGCLLYELLTGQPPFTGDSAVSVAYQHVSEMPKPASQVFSDIPDSIDRVVMKSLSKSREDRYQTASEFRADLNAAARGDGVSAPAVPTAVVAPVTAAAAGAATMIAPRPSNTTSTSTGMIPIDAPTEAKKKNSWMIWLGALLLVLAVVIGYIALSSGRDKDDPEPTPTTTTVAMTTVPELDGLNENQAKNVIENQGLVFKRGADVASDDVPAGDYVSSNPKVGDSVERGTTVTVRFSSGPANVEVPNIIGMTSDEARRALEKVGLDLGQVSNTDSPTGEANTVVEATPGVGTMVATGTAVDVAISTGNTVVPNVVGQQLESGFTALETAGLRVDSRPQQVDSPEQDGIIQSQVPESDGTATAPQKSLVIIYYGVYQSTPTTPATPTATPTAPDGEGPENP